MTLKHAMRGAARAVLMPLIVVACSSGLTGMMPAAAAANDLGSDTAQTAKAAPNSQSENIVDETFLLHNLTIQFKFNGVGGLSMHADAQSGAKNTGTGAYRTDLSMDIASTPLGAGENPNGTNNGLVFTKIQYQDDPRNSNNRTAYVEFEIQPLHNIRNSVIETASSAYTVYPAFARNLDQIDLDSVNAGNAAAQQSYGVRKLKFKGMIQNLNIVTDVFGGPQNAADQLIQISSNGLLITNSNLFRTVYQSADPNGRTKETMVPTPKNIYAYGK